MFCPKCGSKNDDSAAFCGGCGNKLEGTTGAVQQTPAVSTTATGGVTAGDGSTAAAAHKTGRIIGIVVAVAVVAAIAIAAFATGGFNLFGPKYEVKESVDAYSWEELSLISEEIANAGSEEAATDVAKTYNLTTSEGTLDGNQVKFVTLSDGTQASVQIAGFAHDEKTDGGKAGITFIFKSAITERTMNSSYTNAGGWEKSAMRSWLSSSVLGMLPEDLRNKIAPVNKLTNNVGETTEASSVTPTSDTLWLYSATELFGAIDQNQSYGYDDGAIYDAVLNSEGSEYKLFRDARVESNNDNPILAKTYYDELCYWWVRSPYPIRSETFYMVTSDGGLGANGYGNNARGVVPGFCI